MFNYPLRVVEDMVADGRSLKSIEDFIDDRTHHFSEEMRSSLWLVAWAESSRENRRHRVGELMQGKRQLADRVRATVA